MFQRSDKISALWRLPSWPMGGLSAHAHMGRFSENIARWRAHFSSVLVIDLEEVRDGHFPALLAAFLGGSSRTRLGEAASKLGRADVGDVRRALNACPEGGAAEPAKPQELLELTRFYQAHNARLPPLASGGERRWLTQARHYQDL